MTITITLTLTYNQVLTMLMTQCKLFFNDAHDAMVLEIEGSGLKRLPAICEEIAANGLKRLPAICQIEVGRSYLKLIETN